MATIQERLRDVAQCWMHPWFDLTDRHADEFREAADAIDSLAAERDEALAAVTRWESWAETDNHNMMCDCPSCDHFWANAKIELGPAT